MGQYHMTVNLIKREFIHPHMLGDGLKLVEQCGWTPGGTNDALHLLLAVSNGRGGGDFDVPSPHDQWIGRWGGDAIAVIGDYAEASDLASDDAHEVYAFCSEHDEECGQSCSEGDHFRNITADLIPCLEYAYEVVFYGDGWRERRSLFDLVKGVGSSHRIGGGRALRVAGRDVLLADVLRAIHEHDLPALPRRKGETITLEALGL